MRGRCSVDLDPMEGCLTCFQVGVILNEARKVSTHRCSGSAAFPGVGLLGCGRRCTVEETRPAGPQTKEPYKSVRFLTRERPVSALLPTCGEGLGSAPAPVVALGDTEDPRFLRSGLVGESSGCVRVTARGPWHRQRVFERQAAVQPSARMGTLAYLSTRVRKLKLVVMLLTRGPRRDLQDQVGDSQQP